CLVLIYLLNTEEPMPIHFERHQKIARYLDPRTGYQEKTITCEIRRDPLTGRSGRVAHGLGFHIQPLDVAPLLAASEPSCPFCPDRLFKVTPKFSTPCRSQLLTHLGIRSSMNSRVAHTTIVMTVVPIGQTCLWAKNVSETDACHAVHTAPR